MEIPRIRVDDFPRGTPDRRWPDYGAGMLNRLEEFGQPYLLGVVPLQCNEHDFQDLKRLRHAVFAMHGFNHGLDRWRPNSEFDGMSHEDIVTTFNYCLGRLEYGLGDQTVRAFIPPFNLFNQAVLDALEHSLIEVITGGPESYSQMDMSKLDFRGVAFVPSVDEWYTSNGNLTDILQKVPHCPSNRMVTLHLTGDYTL